MKAHTREFDEWYTKVHTKECTKEGMTDSSGASGKHSEMGHLGCVLRDEDKWCRGRERCFRHR